VRAAEIFRRNGQKFLINSSFTKRNQHDIANTFKLAKSLGATAWYMFMIVPPAARGDHERAYLHGGLRGDPEVALPAEKLEDDILMRPPAPPTTTGWSDAAKEEG